MNKRYIDIPKEQCFGCSSCRNACPHDAIRMNPDGMGFLYPDVDESACVGCGICMNVCPGLNSIQLGGRLLQPEIYAARHKDIREVETSRSGAAFIAIANLILSDGGVVYGAACQNGSFKVVHERIDDKKDLVRLKGSKYVQSDIGDVFRKVKDDLKCGKAVLFSGTPCQTAGLNAMIHDTLKERLYLADIVCHGVPSPFIWKDYLKYIKKIYHKNITGVDFRNKKAAGWKGHVETFILNNGKQVRTTQYRDMFYSGLTVREACFRCPFANMHRPADLTLGDFWGWEKLGTDINSDDKGLSLVLCNTRKGNDVFNAIKEDVVYLKTTQEMCMQPNLMHPTPMPQGKAEFELYYMKNGLRRTMIRYEFIRQEKGIIYRMKQLFGRQ